MRFGVSDRAAEQPGDFLVVITFDVDLQKDRTAAEGQLGKRGIESDAVQELWSNRDLQSARRFHFVDQIRKSLIATRPRAKVHEHVVSSESI